jgi:hypothetical protein
MKNEKSKLGFDSITEVAQESDDDDKYDVYTKVKR